jgi:hypothetical protein
MPVEAIARPFDQFHQFITRCIVLLTFRESATEQNALQLTGKLEEVIPASTQRVDLV